MDAELYRSSKSFKRRLHRGNMLPSAYMFVRDTCCLYLGNIITIHLCHGRLVSLCIQQQTGNKLATILLPIYKQHVDGNRTHVADNMLPWCKRGFTFAGSPVSIGAIIVWQNWFRLAVRVANVTFVKWRQGKNTNLGPKVIFIAATCYVLQLKTKGWIRNLKFGFPVT